MALRGKRLWRKNAMWEGTAAEWADHLEDMAGRPVEDWSRADDSSLRRALDFVRSRESRVLPDKDGLRLLWAADQACEKLALFMGMPSERLAASSERVWRDSWASVLHVRAHIIGNGRASGRAVCF